MFIKAMKFFPVTMHVHGTKGNRFYESIISEERCQGKKGGGKACDGTRGAGEEVGVVILRLIGGVESDLRTGRNRDGQKEEYW